MPISDDLVSQNCASVGDLAGVECNNWVLKISFQCSSLLLPTIADLPILCSQSSVDLINPKCQAIDNKSSILLENPFTIIDVPANNQKL